MSELLCMPSINSQSFSTTISDFGSNSVFNNDPSSMNSSTLPEINNAFLLLDTSYFLELDETNLLTLESS